jgi:hypothetical protein
VLFLCTNALLLVMEVTSPYFGWWHAFSLMSSMSFSFIGMGMLHFYSTRMIETVHLRQGGTHIDVNFLNAFFG